MKPEPKAKWLETLRSGKFSQTDGLLRKLGKTNSYCCLGVLCEVLGADWEDLSCREFPIYEEIDNCQNEMLSEELLDEVGLTSTQQVGLAAMNDSGKSFSEIADYIEQNL